MGDRGTEEYTVSGEDRRDRPLYQQVLVSPNMGGGERVAIAIHDRISVERPGSSSLLIPAGGGIARNISELGPPCATYNYQRLLARSPGQSLAANAGAWRRMAPHRVGITHVHAPVIYRALRPALLLSRRKRVLHVHLDYTDEELIRGLKLPPDLVIVCAEFIRRRVEQLARAGGAGQTRVVTIRNAVDTSRFFPGDRHKAKSEMGIDPDRPVVLMAANLAKHKGQETAIRAIASLAQSGYKPLLWLAGEQRDGGDYVQHLKRLAADLGVVEFVSFLGMRNDVDALLRASDFLLLPSTQEGLPLVILEAQASNTVVLAAPTAGIPEVVEDGRTGFVVGATEFEAYAARLRTLIDQRDLQERISEAARAQVEVSFTYAHYIRQVLAEYDLMLGRARG